MSAELDQQKVKEAVRYIDTWLDFNFKNSRIPAMQVAIQSKDAIVYSKSFGYADIANKEELTNKHTFRIASHSKTFTATAIMQLHEAGKLNLEDAVSKHVSWFKSSADSRVAEVTVHQLLNHTAGVIRDGEDADFWQVLRAFPEVDELKEYISKSKLIYDSNEKFKYSNFGFAYLGQVIENVSGDTYGEYVTKNIINKLGLKSTGSELENDIELATGYGIELFNTERKPFEQINTGALAPATGFYSNAEDVCKYFSAHFIGSGRLLKDASKRVMQHGYWEAERGKEKYGLGMVNYDKKHWKLYGHSGGFPGFTTNTKFDSNKQIVVSVLTNSLGAPPKLVNDGILNIIDTFQQQTGSTKPGTDLKKYTGRFYSKWGPTDIVLVGGKLFATEPVYWADFAECEELVLIDKNTLKIEKANGYSSPGEHIKYKFDKDNNISSLVYAGASLVTLDKAKQNGWF